jgi:hypothetical protein
MNENAVSVAAKERNAEIGIFSREFEKKKFKLLISGIGCSI